MSWVGEATGLWSVLSKGWDWWRGRRDPARRAAQRLIRAFEAHGVPRQQIIRLVPAAIAQAKPGLGMADCSSPEQLKPKLTPALLDWAAGYLNLRRDWLDGREDVPPHLVVDHYKHPSRYGTWLQARKAEAADVQRYLSVWKAYGTPVGPGADGPLCLVYEETIEGLDGMERSRYWLLADGWTMGHAPCVENLAAVVHVAQQAGVLVVGKELRAPGTVGRVCWRGQTPSLRPRPQRLRQSLSIRLASRACAPVAQREIEDGRVSAGAGPDRALRHAGPSTRAVPAAFGQWVGLHQPQLHGPGKLRTASRIHHAAQP